MGEINLESSLSALKGVGEKRLALFNAMSIFTINDLLNHLPRDYVDRSEVSLIKHAEVGKVGTINAVVTGVSDNVKINGKMISKITVKDESSAAEIIWFNRPYMRNNFKIGSKYFFIGKIIIRYNKICIECQEYESENKKELLSSNRIVPVYRLTYGLTQKFLRQTIYNALEACKNLAEEVFPREMLEKYDLLDKRDAIRNIHFPGTDEMFFKARARLVFEELFIMQLSLAKLKSFIKSQASFKYADTDIAPILSKCPFSLTNAQNRVIDEMLADIKGEFVINRLVQGDVGSGKTMIAIIMAYLAVKNGGQAAIMAPTEILANQHFESFAQYFDKMGIKVVLLNGSMKKSEKEAVYHEITNGLAKIIIGTHAVIEEKVIFDNLTLVITDEQHRFGVKQREKLVKKGIAPHTIVMSATPIPRTLSMVLYGDMDISIIDEMPPGRKPIETYAVTSDYRTRIFAFLDKQIEMGRQAYIVCPAIDESENENIKDVTTYTNKLQKTLKGRIVTCLHGKMPNIEKQRIMSDFIEGQIDVLVSTTVIEVGINVPNATVMLIENAERFGLSQLHQLRGRVGRGAEDSYCILITDNQSETTLSRTGIMSNTNDGFKVAEKDLELRGGGDFFGSKQHGLPEMKIANLYKDIGQVETVKSAALDVIQRAKSGEEDYIALYKMAKDAFDPGFRDVL